MMEKKPVKLLSRTANLQKELLSLNYHPVKQFNLESFEKMLFSDNPERKKLLEWLIYCIDSSFEVIETEADKEENPDCFSEILEYGLCDDSDKDIFKGTASKGKQICFWERVIREVTNLKDDVEIDLDFEGIFQKLGKNVNLISPGVAVLIDSQPNIKINEEQINSLEEEVLSLKLKLQSQETEVESPIDFHPNLEGVCEGALEKVLQYKNIYPEFERDLSSFLKDAPKPLSSESISALGDQVEVFSKVLDSSSSLAQSFSKLESEIDVGSKVEDTSHKSIIRHFRSFVM